MSHRWKRLAGLLLALLLTPALSAQDAGSRVSVDARLESTLHDFEWPGCVRLPIGVTRQGTLIHCFVEPAALLPSKDVIRSLIVCGLDGRPETVDALRAQRGSPLLGSDIAGRTARAWIPIANPDAWRECVESGAAPQPLGFPPRGSAYNTAGEEEAAVLWRFVEWFAPDDVLVIASSAADAERPDSLTASLRSLDAEPRVVVGVSSVSAFRLITPSNKKIRDVSKRSLSVQEVLQRLNRSPTEVARRLLDHYGHKLNPVMYQPALALVARLRFAALTGEPAHRAAVEKILDPYLAGERSSLPENANGSHFAGHLVFAAWAKETGDERAIALVRRVADRAFDADGRPRDAMPTHNEMSDAVFMACPILVEAGRLTGESRYLDMAVRHLEFMQRLCLRDDGLYRHSPLCETAWGRGNGFPALGLALSLTTLEEILDRPEGTSENDAQLRASAERALTTMRTALQRHLRALLAHQDPTGMWRQVIDHPGAYREMTATCMITFALARAARHGWLEADEVRPAIDRAWEAIKLRVYDDGVLFDVCTGTGKQKSLQDYLDREAILGRDERGGAMALLVAVEMVELLAAEPLPR